jgi:1-acyl-sn-glycerol-3-phosphate acyltransferase
MHALLTLVVRAILRLYIGRHFRIEGLENVPARGPLLVVANHIGSVDPVILGAIFPRDLHFLAKYELFRSPLVAMLARGFHAHPLVRHSADRRALDWSLGWLSSGGALCIFPEGTRVDDARLHPPEPGVGFLVLRSGAPVLPVAFWGTEACLPKGARFPRRVPMNVRFGVPFVVEPDGVSRRSAREQAADEVMRRIAALLPAQYRGVYA